MDLLGQQTQKKQKSKGQKIVLMLLIILIVLLIVIIATLLLLKTNKTNTLSMSVNNADVAIQENMLLSDENGNTYISIENIASLVEYEYLRGGYLEYVEDDNKGYIENDDDQIIGYEANSNKIYKTTKDSYTDYEYYNLNNNIIKSNNRLYIALEDLNVGCNLVYAYSKDANKIMINTTDDIIEFYEEKIEEEEQEIELSYEINNKKAILYNMIIASNKSGKMGVVDGDLKSIIGYKYETIDFNEFAQNFIVSNEDKYGILSKKGNIIVELKYEDIEVINYSPLLYQAKLNGNYGILNEQGQVIVNIEYDEIGYNKSLFIIKNINNNQDGLVVCKNNKYGIVNLKTGEIIVDCEVDKIYNRDGNYYVEVQNNEIELPKYIEYINTTVVTN